MLILLKLILLILIFGGIGFYLACVLSTLYFFVSYQPKPPRRINTPPVSILVSVRGVDSGAWENWLSLCLQNYPDYEILFGVTSADDPAVELLTCLVEKFPQRVRFFAGLEPRGINLKDSNLSYLLEYSRHEIIVLADGDMRFSPDYIHHVTAPLLQKDSEVGMVFCAYIGHNPRSLTSALASLGRGVDFIPSMLVARVLDGNFKFAVGVTMAMRRSTLEQCGGLHTSRIGSDYNLGKRLAMVGDRILLSPHILEWDTTGDRIGDLIRRELRWNRTIRFNRGSQYYGMIFCFGTLFCLPLLSITQFADWAIAISVLAVVVRFLQACLCLQTIKSPRLIHWLWLLPLRDVISFGLWLVGCFGSHIYWRGRYLRIEADGIISSV